MKTKVIYIMGAGRSGSTVLDIVLGNNPNTVSTGELIHLHDRGWQDNNYCACGTRVNQCGFWNNVRQRWQQKAGISVERFLDLQQRYERVRYVLFPGKLEDDVEFFEYRRAIAALIDSVLEASGKSILIDSSKKHVRAYFLSTLEDYDLSVIHLVRDPRGFVRSKTKLLHKDEKGGVQDDQVPKSVIPTALSWISTNLVCGLVRKRLGQRSIRVRYEDFVREPERELDRITAVSGVDLNHCKELLRQQSPIAGSHTVAGNRLRMKRNIRLQLDEEWRSALTRSSQIIVGILSAPLMLLYGYLSPADRASKADVPAARAATGEASATAVNE